MNEKKYGVFSATTKGLRGSWIWTTPDGGEVEVTGVHLKHDCTDCKWPDKVLLGPVVAHVRRVAYGKLSPSPPVNQFAKVDPELAYVVPGDTK